MGVAGVGNGCGRVVSRNGNGNDDDDSGRQPSGRLRGLGSFAAVSAQTAVPIGVGSGGDASTAERDINVLAAGTAVGDSGGGGGIAGQRSGMAESGIVVGRSLLVNCPVGYFGDCECRSTSCDTIRNSAVSLF